ncbi:MAG: sensor histidine kinase [Anaerolineae bacterium]
MFYTAGIWLIYAGVVLRVLERYAGLPQLDLVVLLFALYGLLLLLEPWIVERKALRSAFRNPLSSLKLRFYADRSGELAQIRSWLAVLYLVVQTGLVVAMFSIPPHVDFFAGLFVPLSLQAVLLLGPRPGFLWIAIYPLAMFVPLTANEKGWPFALIMSLFAGGLFFLFGSYAHQVQKAVKARDQNHRLLRELQAANRQLAGHAVQLEELAAEQERNRLARDLHDSVTQTVFSMTLTVQSARLLLAKDPGRAEAQLRRLEELASSAMGEIQVLVSQLRPQSAEQEGLAEALRRLAAERQARDGLHVDVEVDGEQVLPHAVATGLYRIAQEALANVVKHSGTLEAIVRLMLDGQRPCLEIEDLGRGFDPQATLGESGHLGLAGMAEQAREIGLSLVIDSRLDRGTRICVKKDNSRRRG